MIKTVPYSFQSECLDVLEEFKGRAICCLPMGCGKSPVSLWFLKKHPELWPGVVICPAYLKQKWAREAAKHINMPATILSGRTPQKSSYLRSRPLLIVNYDILGPCRKVDGGIFHGWLDFLKDKIKPGCIIIDESQACSLSAGWTAHTKALSEDAKSVIALSGTPFWNYPSGIWPTLNIVRPDLYPKFLPFAWKHCDPKLNRGSWEYKGAVGLGQLRKDLLKTMLFRRRKEEILPDLPLKVRTVVPMEISNRKEYTQAVRRFIDFEQSSNKKSETLNQLGSLKQLAARLKLESVFTWIDAFLVETDEKLLMFGWHREIVERLHERYKDKSVLIYGDISSKYRDTAERMFQTDKKTRILFGNMRAAGTGLDLTAAHTVAFCESAWNPATHTQCEDRAYGRLNDLHGCNVFYLVATGTIEEFLCELNQRKMGMSEELLDGVVGIEGFDIYDQLIEHIKGSSAIPKRLLV